MATKSSRRFRIIGITLLSTELLFLDTVDMRTKSDHEESGSLKLKD